MNKPHQHAELIKAWADGVTIQYFSNTGKCWEDLKSDGTIAWIPYFQYRIKPEPKPDVVFHAQIDDYHDGQCYSTVTLNMLAQTLGEQDNIRLVFDGETGKLKHVELLEQK